MCNATIMEIFDSLSNLLHNSWGLYLFHRICLFELIEEGATSHVLKNEVEVIFIVKEIEEFHDVLVVAVTLDFYLHYQLLDHQVGLNCWLLYFFYCVEGSACFVDCCKNWAKFALTQFLEYFEMRKFWFLLQDELFLFWKEVDASGGSVPSGSGFFEIGQIFLLFLEYLRRMLLFHQLRREGDICAWRGVFRKFIFNIFISLRSEVDSSFLYQFILLFFRISRSQTFSLKLITNIALFLFQRKCHCRRWRQFFFSFQPLDTTLLVLFIAGGYLDGSNFFQFLD